VQNYCMKKLSNWLVVLFLAASTSLTYTACNKVSVAEEGHKKECCSGQADEYSKDGKICDPEDIKNCKHHKSDATAKGEDSPSSEQAHICSEECHENGCNHHG
jgi:hypothetical protein